jgi:hypothetical protein
MKSQTVFYRQLLSIFIATMLMTLASCSVSKRSDQDSSVNNQLGAAIQSHLAESNASSESELFTALLKMKVSKASKVVVSQNKANIIHLYRTDTLLLVIENKYRDYKLAENLSDNNDIPSAISTLVRLFPINAYRILTYVAENNLIDKDTLLAIAVENKLDPTIVLEASATGMENSVTPLIHSAGIVIYGQDEDDTSDVRYREVGDSTWLPALELAWEPIYSALSGSIVHLNADTAYEVEVEITDYNRDTQAYSFNFKTRPNSPPIDPNKIYYLSDIYSGGQLDLEALNIYGSEDGYAKIIGDGQIIEGGDEYLSAVNIGSKAYIMLENLIIKGGQRYGVFAKNTHDIWIKNCDISAFGRLPSDYRNNIGYESTESTVPIRYDSGIYLEKTGVSVIEECDIHSPNHRANHWGDGHPKGPNAIQIYAYHPQEIYRGQIILRNNNLYGTDTHRFNDVIEGRKNFERTGGFVRDSAIYGNYLAFANDDLIEIDGGQRNVVVYENELTQGYAGISLAPNMLGPSYIFHNYIHDLGDERGKEWTAIKVGGLMAKPGGKNFIIENLIKTNRNGISSSSVNGDTTFWVELLNNVIVTRNYASMVGYTVYDREKYTLSRYDNNIFLNLKSETPRVELDYNQLHAHPLAEEFSSLELLTSDDSGTLALPLVKSSFVKNFSREYVPATETMVSNFNIGLKQENLSHFHNQTKYGEASVVSEKEITIVGNGWYKMPIDHTILPGMSLSFDYMLKGDVEISGIALETNNSLSKSAVFQLSGSQAYGNDLTHLAKENEMIRVTIQLDELLLNNPKYIVFILDNDIPEQDNSAIVTFRNLTLSLGSKEYKSSEVESKVIVGIGES